MIQFSMMGAEGACAQALSSQNPRHKEQAQHVCRDKPDKYQCHGQWSVKNLRRVAQELGDNVSEQELD